MTTSLGLRFELFSDQKWQHLNLLFLNTPPERIWAEKFETAPPLQYPYFRCTTNRFTMGRMPGIFTEMK